MKTPHIVIGTAIAATLIGVGAMALAGVDQEGARAAASLTARWAFVWFITAWSASSVAKLWPGGWRAALLRRRRAVGLGFAANHFVHLGFVFAALSFGAERSMVTFIFANSYVGRLLGEKPLVGAFGVTLLVVAIGLRIAAFAKGRARLQAA